MPIFRSLWCFCFFFLFFLSRNKLARIRWNSSNLKPRQVLIWGRTDDDNNKQNSSFKFSSQNEKKKKNSHDTIINFYWLCNQRWLHSVFDSLKELKRSSGELKWCFFEDVWKNINCIDWKYMINVKERNKKELSLNSGKKIFIRQTAWSKTIRQ